MEPALDSSETLDAGIVDLTLDVNSALMDVSIVEGAHRVTAKCQLKILREKQKGLFGLGLTNTSTELLNVK